MDERFMATKICNKLISEQIISEKDFDVYVYAYEITLSEIFNIIDILILVKGAKKIHQSFSSAPFTLYTR